MTRFAKPWLTLLLGLALFVQAVPAALCAQGCAMGATSVATPLPKIEADSAEVAVSTQHSCCPSKGAAKLTDNSDDEASQMASVNQGQCNCGQMASCQTVAVQIPDADKALRTSFDASAILPVWTEIPLVRSLIAEPGIFGNDSGPPVDRPYLFGASRAPPVA
ncbi:MAG: hypothetical protein KF784_02825 [Fimbriimonadaceae bacterium]|nr:hypothetical protein [Fimbriimonadaceae bacterium]